MISSHTNLPNWFTLKTYSKPTTWSMFAMQQSPITSMNTQPHWRNTSLQTTQNSTLWILNERLEMMWHVKFNPIKSVPPL